MNKDGSINNKSPVSGSKVQRFMSVVWMIADEFGIDKVEDVYHHVELLGESVARHVYENNNKITPQKKVHVERKKYITIFKKRYAQLMDIEYRKPIKPQEAKLINQANKMLKESGFNCDEYLEWFFDEFLSENPKFVPPMISSSCAHFFLHSFLHSNKELKDARKRQELNKKSSEDLIHRARILLRHSLPEEDEVKVQQTLKDYGDRKVSLSEFRKVIQGIESKVKNGEKKNVKGC